MALLRFKEYLSEREKEYTYTVSVDKSDEKEATKVLSKVLGLKASDIKPTNKSSGKVSWELKFPKYAEEFIGFAMAEKDINVEVKIK